MTDPSGNRTVLVVDDEPDICSLLSHLLQGAIPKVRCATAASGVEALKGLAAQRPDVILSDFRMPGMDGVHFLIASQQAAPDARRLLMSAYPELDASVADLNAARIKGFLAKPFDPDHVVAAVTAALSSRS